MASRVKEFQQRTGMSNAFFWERVKQNKIHIIYFGKSPRVPAEEEERILREGVE
jgi:predicted DNA-binding transcriptional regulator AlpA